MAIHKVSINSRFMLILLSPRVSILFGLSILDSQVRFSILPAAIRSFFTPLDFELLQQPG